MHFSIKTISRICISIIKIRRPRDELTFIRHYGSNGKTVFYMTPWRFLNSQMQHGQVAVCTTIIHTQGFVVLCLVLFISPVVYLGDIVTYVLQSCFTASGVWAPSQYKDSLPRYDASIIKISRSWDHFFNIIELRYLILICSIVCELTKYFLYMAAILQMTFSNSFSCMKIVLWFKFHWNLLIKINISYSNARRWIGNKSEPMTSFTAAYVSRPRWVNSQARWSWPSYSFSCYIYNLRKHLHCHRTIYDVCKW